MQATLKKEDFRSFTDFPNEALIDPDWASKPTRLWNDVYNDLCKDLGEHYGLNDIREAK